MAHCRHLPVWKVPVWKAALDLAGHLEHAARRFPRYHKYTPGSELRPGCLLDNSSHQA